MCKWVTNFVLNLINYLIVLEVVVFNLQTFPFICSAIHSFVSKVGACITITKKNVRILVLINLPWSFLEFLLDRWKWSSGVLSIPCLFFLFLLECTKKRSCIRFWANLTFFLRITYSIFAIWISLCGYNLI